jgi:hypothetical protein
MQKWEYLFLTRSREWDQKKQIWGDWSWNDIQDEEKKKGVLLERLNELGDRGWEVVGFTQETYGAMQVVERHFLLKRLKE